MHHRQGGVNNKSTFEEHLAKIGAKKKAGSLGRLSFAIVGGGGGGGDSVQAPKVMSTFLSNYPPLAWEDEPLGQGYGGRLLPPPRTNGESPFMAGGAQWCSVAPSGAQWRKSAAVGGGRRENLLLT